MHFLKNKSHRWNSKYKIDILQDYIQNKHTSLDPRYLSGTVKRAKCVKISQQKSCFTKFY